MNFLSYFGMYVLSVIENSAISLAISDVIDAIFISYQIDFDIIVYGEKTFGIKDILDGIQGKNYELATRQIYIHSKQNWNGMMNKSAVIIMNDYATWLDFCNSTELGNEYYKPMKFLIYYLDSDLEDFYRTPFNSLFYFNGEIEHYSYFIINKEESVALLNLEWFTPAKCNKAQPIIINELDKSKFKWHKPLSISEKFKQFHNCLLTIDIAHRFQQTHFTLDGKPYGPLVDLFKGMSVRGNFTPYFQQIERSNSNHEVKFTLKSDTKLSLLPNILISMPLITNQKLYVDLHYSTLFHEETLSFMLTPPEHYSAYEKLFLPFDAATWVCFVIIFVYAFLSVLVINFISKGVQDVVYGTNVKTPYFNVIGTFFGVSQLKLPEANFPRILLMTFILYCLVLRTAYQSLLFEYVATDMRKSSPTTIEELHSNGYIVYALDIANDRLMSMLPENDRPNIKIISKREFKNILMNTENYENAKFALCELLYTFKLFLDLHPKTFVLLKQNLYTTMTGYTTSKNHFLYELMNEIAQELVSAGLLQHAIEMSYSEDFMRTKLSIRQDLTERGSISFSDFAYGFTLWIFFMSGLLCCVFIGID